MSVLVYAENWEGKFRKSTFEVVSYASQLAKSINSEVHAITFGNILEEELIKIGDYGAVKVYNYNKINKSNNQAIAKIFTEYQNFSVFIFSNSFASRSITPILSIKIGSSYVSNVVSLLDFNNKTVRKQSFSSKAFELVKINTEKVILSISSNAFGLIENKVNCNIELLDTELIGNLNIESQEKSRGKISLSEADIIVSAGRGMKGPENWHLIESLASEIGAATACSKPVSDSGWRPHSEHVGQTGKAVSPNLYIAIGISGAIQHLAGVNSSKVMVVINTDPDAPFFKAADYGIIGDAFEVVPKLIEAIKNFKN
ncbi:MAG: electron transfer flavoprotein subunit alpha [Flavobacteriales bacterium]|nr:electron transfer flavoprotein subunit alpha [Flavobacteriales bacterium]|tara:strand:+ start:562 stop:1503 length:942 start_codon:yes stop_codon:yes gene_type:complete